LRIHPVAMLTFPRVVKEPVELLGQQLEPGKRWLAVFISLISVRIIPRAEAV